MTFDAIRDCALALPGVTEAQAQGRHSFLVRGTLFVRLMEDGATLLVRTDHYERDHLLESEPETFLVTDSIREHPWVKVRLARADQPQLLEMVRDAWRRVAPPRLVRDYDAPAG
jgi:hypothetical protein